MLTYAEALKKLKRQTAADVEPVLNGNDLAALLADHLEFSAWSASTAYVYGDRIIPTTANGRLYECRVAGTSDTTEPDWGDTSAINDAYDDGDTLQWVDVGPMPVEQHNVRAATRDGWLLKAARLSCECDVTVGPQKFALSQRVANCERMAARYAPLVVA